MKPVDMAVSTPFGRRGKYWSCRKNSEGGIHTGDDFACARGTRLVAAISGTIRHRSYGSAFGPYQFAISPSSGQPFADGEVFYAHTLDRLPDGTEVKMGDFVAHSGDLGNVSGPHLHFEFHPSAKNVWNCDVVADPQPIYDHGPQSGGGGSVSSGPYVTKDIYSDKLGYGQEDSDSVKELQELLNRIKLVGGANLPVTGNYHDMTDAEVRKWQEQIVHDTPDPAGKSFLGPAQRAAMFPSPPYTIHDRGLPAIASGGGGGGGGDVAPPPPPPVVDDKPAAPSLLIPGAIWDPIRKKDGGWFTGLRPFKGSAKKITLHTTETDSFPNWEAQQSGIPHITVDLDGHETRQHLPFDIAAYTLKGGDFSPNSDSGMNIQIEIVGRASQSHDWGDVAYSRLKSLLEWVSYSLDIPYEFPWHFGPAGSSHRVDWPQWENISGVLGHLHVPWNDHWDPGDLDISRLALPEGPDPEEPPAPVGDYVTREEYEADMDRISEAFGSAGDPE